MDIDGYNDLHIDEIRKEYRRIDNAWLHLHFKIAVGLVVFSFLIECLMALLIVNSDLLTTTVEMYIWKFIVVPSGVNLMAVIIGAVVVKSPNFSQTQKIYAVSLVFSFICFALFAVHHSFSATYYLFAMAIVLTTIYVNYRVTTVTAAVSITAMVVTELFIKWDLDKVSIFDSIDRMGDFLIAFFIVLGCFLACMIEISYEKQKNEASILKEIERQLLAKKLQTDELTGVLSRKALHDAMRDMVTNQGDDRYIFVMCDIDNFKNLNDSFGHHMGDVYLVRFAKLLKESSGKASVFRYGGDEFCLLFRNANMDEVVSACGRIQQKMKGILFDNMSLPQVTASFGIAAYTDGVNAARLFINADMALYEAKKTRNALYVFAESGKASTICDKK